MGGFLFVAVHEEIVTRPQWSLTCDIPSLCCFVGLTFCENLFHSLSLCSLKYQLENQIWGTKLFLHPLLASSWKLFCNVAGFRTVLWLYFITIWLYLNWFDVKEASRALTSPSVSGRRGLLKSWKFRSQWERWVITPNTILLLSAQPTL